MPDNVKNACTNNTRPCECANITCKNHGKCCACVAHHKELGNIPNCFKTEGK